MGGLDGLVTGHTRVQHPAKQVLRCEFFPQRFVSLWHIRIGENPPSCLGVVFGCSTPCRIVRWKSCGSHAILFCEIGSHIAFALLWWAFCDKLRAALRKSCVENPVRCLAVTCSAPRKILRPALASWCVHRSYQAYIHKFRKSSVLPAWCQISEWHIDGPRKESSCEMYIVLQRRLVHPSSGVGHVFLEPAVLIHIATSEHIINWMWMGMTRKHNIT